MRRRVAILVVLGLLGGLISGLAPLSDARTAHAASGADFNAGDIISDAEFYTPDTMSIAQIQSFLRSKVPNCAAGYTCLTNYTEATPAQPSRTGCSYYGGSGGQSAASIIWWAGHVCGINPKVLLVLLEKEQALVTDSTPSARQYRSATGFACPDTAACDSAYYGFTNQLFSAAAQYKRYQAYPNSFGYVAGRVNKIAWSPNAACGTSQVYIANQATAGLYDYTPYRPNAAALNNMYGIGDSCSAYGNRNFFRIYTDWFGSTHSAVTPTLVSSSGKAYLIVGKTRYYIPDPTTFQVFARLGAMQDVSAAYLATFSASATPASPVVNDLSTGKVYLAQTDGTLHWFSSCALVSEFGYSCSAVTSLTGSLVAAYRMGAPVTPFYSVPGDGRVWWESQGSRYYVATYSALLALNGGTAPWVGTAAASVASRPVVRSLLAPGSMVTGSDRVTWFIDGLGSRIRVADPAVAGEFSPAGTQRIDDGVISGYPVGAGTLGFTAKCGQDTVVAAGGRLVVWRGDAADATPAGPTLSADECSRMPSGGTVTGPLFIRSTSDPVVYGYSNGTRFPVPTWDSLLAMSGGAVPPIEVVAQKTLAALPLTAAPPATGSLTTAAGDPDVYVVDGRTRSWIRSFTTASELGLPKLTWSTPASLAATTRTSAAFSRQVVCGGAVRFGVAGRLVALTGSAVTGLATTTPSAALCSQLALSADAPRSQVFITSPEQTVVYQLTGGVLRPVKDWARLMQLTQGTDPRILFAGRGGLSDIPVGPAA